MTTSEPRQSRSATIGFSIPMDRIETADRAQRLRDLQTYEAERTADLAISTDEISYRVKRVLARRR